MGFCGVPDVKHVDRSLVDYSHVFSQDGGFVSQLERLARLHEQGYLTREEFEAQKARLLG